VIFSEPSQPQAQEAVKDEKEEELEGELSSLVLVLHAAEDYEDEEEELLGLINSIMH